MQINFPKIIAHRGASLCFPENTLLAMQQAKVLGADWVELDVQLSKDLQPVIFHDKSLKRIAHIKSEVGKLALTQLKNIDVGSWKGAQFDRERIPMLHEMITELQQLGLSMNLELKPWYRRIEALLDAVLEVLDQSYTDLSNLPVLSSFNKTCMFKLKARNTRYPLALLFDRWHFRWRHYARLIEPVSINLNYKILNAKRVKAIKQAGFVVLAYTVNSVDDAKKLFSWGVDGIFTDDFKTMSEANL